VAVERAAATRAAPAFWPCRRRRTAPTTTAAADGHGRVTGQAVVAASGFDRCGWLSGTPGVADAAVASAASRKGGGFSWLRWRVKKCCLLHVVLLVWWVEGLFQYAWYVHTVAPYGGFDKASTHGT